MRWDLALVAASARDPLTVIANVVEHNPRHKGAGVSNEDAAYLMRSLGFVAFLPFGMAGAGFVLLGRVAPEPWRFVLVWVGATILLVPAVVVTLVILARRRADRSRERIASLVASTPGGWGRLTWTLASAAGFATAIWLVGFS